MEVTNISKVDADLKWLEPSSDGGSPITNYVVEKRDVRRKAWQTVDTTIKELKYTVTALNEGSLYVFRVAAENAVGTSEFCELEDAVLAKDTFSKFITTFIPHFQLNTPNSWESNVFNFKTWTRLFLNLGIVLRSNSWTSLRPDSGRGRQKTCGAEMGATEE